MAAPRRLLRNVVSTSSRFCDTGFSLTARSSGVNPLSARFAHSKYSFKSQTSSGVAPLLVRYSSTNSTLPNSLTDRKPATPEEDAYNEARRAEEPSYLITFTCKPCSHRSGHRISKHGYHKGTVLIMCPNCRNRHVISDHLNIFMDTKSTLEDILAKQGQSLRKVTLGEGDMELWPETSNTTDSEVTESSEKKS
ncbi:hypothetical protein D8B26_002030 [Coccidioides posadasii str. Silveira]|uniref:TIM23 translocase complex subunit Tim15 n=1 Tax=Coccidioides posadasii (strain RMSCC 757 / Silveira) TaxID=443226 RepID=E9CX98_COCPS|nr:TIM23 translocase complex subunit Tim15 [Coccidioides posadasii str. Silveira]QVM07330.1 hypothetical protein D8B26_002030 [Coccidioides posadasii str. Silveira]